MQHPGACGEIIQVIPHGSAEVAQWQVPAKRPNPTSLRTSGAAALIRLEPLDPSPPPHPDADEVIAGWASSTRTGATPSSARWRAVTEREVEQPAHTSGGTGAAPHRPRRAGAPVLPLPKFLTGGQAASPADIGSATHLVLQHLDFSRPLDAADLDVQVAGLIHRRLLDEAAASLVDRRGILWFVGTDVGQLLRTNEGRLLRELPVYYAAEPPLADENDGPPPDALDRVMVRGRLDVLGARRRRADDRRFQDRRGRRGRGRRARRAPPAQIEQYRQAVQAITGRPVARAYLVFLSAREIRKV